MNSTLLMSKWGRVVAKQLMKPIKKYKPEHKASKWNIVRGDFVEVIQGPQTGQKGKVLDILRKDNRIIIENVNMVYVIIQ
jgi:transcription antitermination factor NusG